MPIKKAAFLAAFFYWQTYFVIPAFAEMTVLMF